MIYISTYYGLFRYSEDMDEPERVMDNWDTTGWFERPSKGIFGLTYDPGSDRILMAVLERRKFPWVGRMAREQRFYYFDPDELEYEYGGKVTGVYDAHQIESYEDEAFMTDAVENRIIRFDLESRERQGEIHIGPVREDLHHPNAVLIYEGDFWVGLNKSPEGISKILRMSLEDVLERRGTTFDILKEAEIINHEEISDSHDLVPYRDSFISCASASQYVFDVETKEKLVEGAGWTRGIAVTDRGVWVGSSEEAKRANRDRKSDGYLHLFSHDSFDLLEKVTLPNSGQVYDILNLDAERENHRQKASSSE